MAYIKKNKINSYINYFRNWDSVLDMFHRETGALSATKDTLRSKWQNIHAAEKKAARVQLQSKAKERLLEIEPLHANERLQRNFISQQHGTGTLHF